MPTFMGMTTSNTVKITNIEKMKEILTRYCGLSGKSIHDDTLTIHNSQ
jgi:hypothetical protein